MKRAFLLLLVVVALAACAKPVPVRPADPAYKFKAGNSFELSLAETIEHKPMTAAERPMTRASSARYDLRVIAVREDGAAHLSLRPVFGQSVLTALGQPAYSVEMWGSHPRDVDDHSEGARYITGAVDEGLHVVVDAEGRWLRDFRGLTPPENFLTEDEWEDNVRGLTLYPNPHLPKNPPTWMTTFVSGDWRKTKTWTWRGDFGVFPPMTGFIPVEMNVRLMRREGSLLYLTGSGRQAGATRTTPALGLVVQGERTKSLEFTDAVYQGRFDLDLGMPIESHFVLTWKSTRVIDGVGEVPANDRIELVFRLRKR